MLKIAMMIKISAFILCREGEVSCVMLRSIDCVVGLDHLSLAGITEGG